MESTSGKGVESKMKVKATIIVYNPNIFCIYYGHSDKLDVNQTKPNF